MQKIVSMNYLLIQMDEGIGFVKRRTYNKIWNREMWTHRCGVPKYPSMIKLEWDSIEVYCKRIQLENSFWSENCVYICLLFVWVFIALVFIVWMNICIHEIWAVGINGRLLLSANIYSSIGARSLLLSCLRNWMSFMVSFVIDVCTLHLVSNSV